MVGAAEMRCPSLLKLESVPGPHQLDLGTFMSGHSLRRMLVPQQETDCLSSLLRTAPRPKGQRWSRGT